MFEDTYYDERAKQLIPACTYCLNEPALRFEDTACGQKQKKLAEILRSEAREEQRTLDTVAFNANVILENIKLIRNSMGYQEESVWLGPWIHNIEDRAIAIIKKCGGSDREEKTA